MGLRDTSVKKVYGILTHLRVEQLLDVKNCTQTHSNSWRSL